MLSNLGQEINPPGEGAKPKFSIKGFLKKPALAIFPYIGVAALWLLCATIRKSVEGQKWEEEAKNSSPGVIYVFWHNRLFYFAYYYRGSKGNILTSRSRDGELISRVIKLLGFNVVRGSSSRGGLEAYLQLSRRLKEGESVALAPDGPRGPRYQVHQGVISLAGRSGCPLLPMTNGFKRRKVFRSWDSFVLPYPFTKCRVIFGEPVFVPRKADSHVLELKRQELEKTLNEITAKVDTAFA